MIEKIQAAVAPEMTQLNAVIEATLRCDTPLMNEIVEGYLRTKGKQLRPLLVLLSGRYFGKVNDAVMHGGAAVELLHNASLIHDDVIDEAEHRRGQATINNVWSNHVAVLVGDYFVTAALRCAVNAGDARVLEELAAMGRDLSLGEITQVGRARDHDIDEATYMEIIGKKTASLFQCCVAIGGYTAGGSDEEIALLREYARLLGICFQMKDDTFDYYDNATIGKPTGNDLREGKITLPLIYALRQHELPQCEAMNTLVRKPTLSSDDIETLVAYAKQAGGIDYTFGVMEHLRAEACATLDRLRPCETVEWLKAIFTYIITRSH